MAEPFDRIAHEKKLANVIGSSFSGYAKQIVAQLGEVPSMSDVPASMWHAIETDLGAAVMPSLAQAYAESAVSLGNLILNNYQVDVGGAVDWTLVNKQAAAWVKQYSYELVTGINDTSKTRLQAAISGFFENQQTMGELREQVGGIFGPERAAMIATTEVTRAAVEGELVTIGSIEDNSHLKMLSTFHTDEDEFVCDECAPLDGTVVTEDNYPPLHPRCRCALGWAPEGW